MSNLISRQAVLDELESMHHDVEEWGRKVTDCETQARAELYMVGIKEMKRKIEKMPSAQHTATWELDEQQEHVEKIWHCSNCGYRAWGSYEKTDFCGGCGADMRGGNDE